MKIKLCESYIGYRITVSKLYVTYMGRGILLLRSVYYKPFVMKRYITMGEIEKNVFSVK